MPTKCVECNKKQAFFNRVGETQARYCKPCALKIWPNEKAKPRTNNGGKPLSAGFDKALG